MKSIRPLAFVLFGYVALVVAFECFVGFMGRRHAERGVAADDREVVIATTSADGRTNETVVAGVEIEGHLYVAANHWPRAWYERALANPNVLLTSGAERAARVAVPIAGDELARVASRYQLPFFLRVLTGFPPRRFLRLDPH